MPYSLSLPQFSPAEAHVVHAGEMPCLLCLPFSFPLLKGWKNSSSLSKTSPEICLV